MKWGKEGGEVRAWGGGGLQAATQECGRWTHCGGRWEKEEEEKGEEEEEEEWAGRLGSGAGAGCSAKTCARLLCCDQVVGMHWSHYCILRKVITYHLVARNILGFRPLPKSVVIMLKGKMGW